MAREREKLFECKLTPELSRSIIEGVRLGLFDAQNALRHGIDVTTLKSWVDRGIDEDAIEPYKAFAEAYIRASIQLEEEVIGIVLAAGREYRREVESEEITRGLTEGDSCDSYDSAPGGRGAATRKTRRERQRFDGDWKAAAWFAERRWPLRWGVTRQPEGGPKEMIKLPDAPLQRRRKVDAMLTAPPPELIKALRASGWRLVRDEPAPLDPQAHLPDGGERG